MCSASIIILSLIIPPPSHVPHPSLSTTSSQLYPYHLQDMLVQGLRVTPFAYYCGMTFDIMLSEKSYDALPNFTAADCKGFGEREGRREGGERGR